MARTAGAVVTVVTVVTLASVVAGCAGSTGAARPVEQGQSAGEIAPTITPVIAAAPSEFGMAALLTGRLRLRSGCLVIRGHLPVWPHGAAWDASHRAVRVPSGGKFVVGDRIEVGGGSVPLSTDFPQPVAATARARLRDCSERTGIGRYWLVSPV